MPLSYIALSISFVFLFLAVDEYFKKNHDLMGRFVCVSLVANLMAMFSFIFPVRVSDTHRGGNGIATAEGKVKVDPDEFSKAVEAREETHRRINEDLREMNQMTTDMLVDLGEIKGMLRCYAPLESLEESLEESPDTGVSDTPK